jgi:hypothetical protein
MSETCVCSHDVDEHRGLSGACHYCPCERYEEDANA